MNRLNLTSERLSIGIICVFALSILSGLSPGQDRNERKPPPEEAFGGKPSESAATGKGGRDLGVLVRQVGRELEKLKTIQRKKLFQATPEKSLRSNAEFQFLMQQFENHVRQLESSVKLLQQNGIEIEEEDRKTLKLVRQRLRHYLPDSASHEAEGKKPKTAMISDRFKAEMDMAMKAVDIDDKIAMFGLLIADSSNSDAEIKLARNFRMKLLVLRSKPGDLEQAIRDAKATGKKGLPVAVKKGATELSYSLGGETIKTPINEGQILVISQIDSSLVWVASVEGDRSKKGWINKSKLFKSPKRREVETPKNSDGFGGKFYPGDDLRYFDPLLQDELKSYEQELEQIEKALKNPFNGLSPWEVTAARRELETYKKELQNAKKLRQPTQQPSIFAAGGRPGLIGGLFGDSNLDPKQEAARTDQSVEKLIQKVNKRINATDSDDEKELLAEVKEKLRELSSVNPSRSKIK